MEAQENRQFGRLRASLPCSVAWEEAVFPAEVTNLSHGGALIMRAGRLPKIRFRARARQSSEHDPPASFGVEFSETHQEIESKLIRLMDILYPSDGEDGEEESED
jgi:hypothetical protein